MNRDLDLNLSPITIGKSRTIYRKYIHRRKFHQKIYKTQKQNIVKYFHKPNM
jgi:hypothetical protein